jgi:hypothetical protein
MPFGTGLENSCTTNGNNGKIIDTSPVVGENLPIIID